MSFASLVVPAWRSLRRSPAFTITASLTLVIGIGATVAIFALVNGVLLRPLPYREPERLVGAWHEMKAVTMDRANQMSSTYFTYKKFAKSIEGIAIYQEGAVNVSEPGGGSEPQRISTTWMTQSLLPVLGVSPLMGRNFSEAEDLPNGPDVVIISEGLWRSRFGANSGVLGRTLEVNGRSKEIIGVMPARFRFQTASTQLWLPLQLDPNATYSDGFNFDGVARLKPGIDVDAAQRDFAAVLPRILEVFPQMAPGVPMQMVLDQAKPVPVLSSMKSDVTGGIARTLWLVAIAAVLVLLVACANVTNLVLVRADARQRELAVREALGAGRGTVLGYFLAESVVITAIAGAIGLGLAWLAVRTLVNAGPADIPRLAEVRVDLVTVGFAIIVSTLVAVICSIFPALRVGRMQLSNALREGGRGGTAGRVRQRMRSALVATQIAFALVALAGSGLMIRTFQRLNEVRPGFNPANLATFWMSLPEARYPNDTVVVRFYSQLLERVGSLPGVQSAGLTSRLPLVARGRSANPMYPDDDPSYATKIPPLQLFTTADGGYFRTMSIPLLAGRTFSSLETQRYDDAIISRATALQFWKDSTGQRALGHRFQDLPDGPWYTIVGVVGDARDTALATPPLQTVYFPQVPAPKPLGRDASRTMALVVRTAGDPAAAVPAVQRAVRELDPALPLFDVRPMTAVFTAATAQLSFIILVIGAAAVVTLLLGAIGLYGVMAYVVTLRTRELGLRIALGASPGSVVAMLTKQGVVLTAIGVVGGLVIFALGARFLRTMLFGVAPLDPVTLGLASVVLVAVATLASWIPAQRTARLDPAEVLRAE